MPNAIDELVLTTTGAKSIARRETIQRLWDGYGDIVRYRLNNGAHDSVVVKHVQLPSHSKQSDLSHRRKIRSYQVETAWYRHWAGRCGAACRVPACLAYENFGDDVVLVLEDLDAAGFPQRRNRIGGREMHACLHWLAHFHASFFGAQAQGLWATGTYWHLATRPDELQALGDTALQHAAAAIDRKLRASPYQTLVHGDAKLANFCFSRDGARVAAVDFQYVGGGCGIKDVAYFIDSCLAEPDCERQAGALLDIYFQALKPALRERHPNVDAEAVEQDWRALYPVAWVDFHRFLKGWSPGHWHPDSYSERLARHVIAELQDN